MSFGSAGDSLAVGDRALRRAATWLGRHGMVEIPPTRLLAARLQARRRIKAAVVTVVAVIGVVTVLTLTGRHVSPHTTGLVNGVLVAVTVLANWLLLRAERRADRRIGGALSRRVAHTTPVGWRTVLGPARLAISVAMFVGGLGIG